jgi:hypothetical protein
MEKLPSLNESEPTGYRNSKGEIREDESMRDDKRDELI